MGNRGRGSGPQGWEKEAGEACERAREREASYQTLSRRSNYCQLEHPGSAGSAERELNKELREEESGEKSARGAGSSPVGLFLCPVTPLCAPQRCPIRPGSCVGLGVGEWGALQEMHLVLAFLYLEDSGTRN